MARSARKLAVVPTLERFPHLSLAERIIVKNFEEIPEDRAPLFGLLHHWVEAASRQSHPEEEKASVLKLMDLGGLYEVIPVSDIRHIERQPGGFHLSLLPIDLPHKEVGLLEWALEAGIFPLQVIRSLRACREILSIKKASGETYEERFFNKNSKVADARILVIPRIGTEASPISATSEPLTRTVILSASHHATDDDCRDLGSFIFDLVQQLVYLDIFSQAEGVLDRAFIHRAMACGGFEFALDYFEHIYQQYTQSGEVVTSLKEGTMHISSPGEDTTPGVYLTYVATYLVQGTLASLLAHNDVFSKMALEMIKARKLPCDPRVTAFIFE